MGSGPGQTDATAVDDLRASVGRVSLEIQALADRVQELVTAVESLAPPQPSAEVPILRLPRKDEIVVSVSPLPELAMAAVAETALRGLARFAR